MPPPYPEEWARNRPGFALGHPARGFAKHCKRNYMNLLVTYFGFLALGEPAAAPAGVRLGLELTDAQRTIVDRL